MLIRRRSEVVVCVTSLGFDGLSCVTFGGKFLRIALLSVLENCVLIDS